MRVEPRNDLGRMQSCPAARSSDTTTPSPGHISEPTLREHSGVRALNALRRLRFPLRRVFDRPPPGHQRRPCTRLLRGGECRGDKIGRSAGLNTHSPGRQVAEADSTPGKPDDVLHLLVTTRVELGRKLELPHRTFSTCAFRWRTAFDSDVDDLSPECLDANHHLGSLAQVQVAGSERRTCVLDEVVGRRSSTTGTTKPQPRPASARTPGAAAAPSNSEVGDGAPARNLERKSRHKEAHGPRELQMFRVSLRVEPTQQVIASRCQPSQTFGTWAFDNESKVDFPRPTPALGHERPGRRCRGDTGPREALARLQSRIPIRVLQTQRVGREVRPLLEFRRPRRASIQAHRFEALRTHQPPRQGSEFGRLSLAGSHSNVIRNAVESPGNPVNAFGDAMPQFRPAGTANRIEDVNRCRSRSTAEGRNRMCRAETRAETPVREEKDPTRATEFLQGRGSDLRAPVHRGAIS